MHIAKRPPSAERRVERWRRCPCEPHLSASSQAATAHTGKAEGGGDVEGGVALMGGRGMNVLLTLAP